MQNFTRTLFAAALLGLTFTALAPARADHDGVRRESRRLQWLDARVGGTLSNGQKQVIDPLLDTTNRQENVVRRNPALPPAEKKAECHALHTRCWTQIGNILTPQQRQAYADSKRHGAVEPANEQ